CWYTRQHTNAKYSQLRNSLKPVRTRPMVVAEPPPPTPEKRVARVSCSRQQEALSSPSEATRMQQPVRSRYFDAAWNKTVGAAFTVTRVRFIIGGRQREKPSRGNCS